MEKLIVISIYTVATIIFYGLFVPQISILTDTILIVLSLATIPLHLLMSALLHFNLFLMDNLE